MSKQDYYLEPNVQRKKGKKTDRDVVIDVNDDDDYKSAKPEKTNKKSFSEVFHEYKYVIFAIIAIIVIIILVILWYYLGDRKKSVKQTEPNERVERRVAENYAKDTGAPENVAVAAGTADTNVAPPPEPAVVEQPANAPPAPAQQMPVKTPTNTLAQSHRQIINTVTDAELNQYVNLEVDKNDEKTGSSFDTNKADKNTHETTKDDAEDTMLLEDAELDD